MLVHLREQVTAETAPTNLLPGPARWQLQSLYLVVAAQRSMAEYERHIGATIGSSEWLWDTADTLRFDKATRELQSLRLRVPELNITPPGTAERWLSISPQNGRLRLEAGENFALEPATIRWLDPAGAALVCGDERIEQADATSLRLRVAPDVDLLFVNNTLCGWLLAQPARYLVESWEEPAPATPSAELNQALYRYYTLVSETSFEQMDDGDPDILAALIDLHTRLGAQPATPQRDVLRTSIAAVVDTFYDQTLDDPSESA